MGKYLPKLPSMREKPWMWAFLAALYVILMLGQWAIPHLLPPTNPVKINSVEQRWREHNGTMGWEISMEVDLSAACGLDVDRSFLLNGRFYNVAPADAYAQSVIGRSQYLREAPAGRHRIYHWYPIEYQSGLQYVTIVHARWCENDYVGPVLPQALRQPIEVKAP